MPFITPKNYSLLESEHLIGATKCKYYLIYEDKENTYWWSKFLKTGYKHVFALYFDGLFWSRLDFTIGWVQFDVLTYKTHATIKDIIKGQNVTAQYVETWRIPRYRVRMFLAPWTCTEMMKSLLGIRAWWVITPYQLFKYCEAHNGT